MEAGARAGGRPSSEGSRWRPAPAHGTQKNSTRRRDPIPCTLADGLMDGDGIAAPRTIPRITATGAPPDKTPDGTPPSSELPPAKPSPMGSWTTITTTTSTTLHLRMSPADATPLGSSRLAQAPAAGTAGTVRTPASPGSRGLQAYLAGQLSPTAATATRPVTLARSMSWSSGDAAAESRGGGGGGAMSPSAKREGWAKKMANGYQSAGVRCSVAHDADMRMRLPHA